MVNLVKNAMESMEEGGELTVITRVTPVGIAMDLIDTGCGMSENTALNMFSAFYTTKPAGSGLGCQWQGRWFRLMVVESMCKVRNRRVLNLRWNSLRRHVWIRRRTNDRIGSRGI